MDTIKDFTTSGPVIKAAAKVHDIAIPTINFASNNDFVKLLEEL